ncbi:hypothetical protein [Neptuniibacter sp. QD57_21]|uniref:hypothetical protein n=1 Tax=Neptuniibacter sp. QD57_21 TaxID=3398213 RepID=UPI0039F52D22
MLLFLLLSGCVSQDVKEANNTAHDSEERWEYRISLEKVDRFLRYGNAFFKVERRIPDNGKKKNDWVLAPNLAMSLRHVGKELRAQADSLTTDAQGQIVVRVELKDSLKYFRWVNKRSYGIHDSFLNEINDIDPISPIKAGQEWNGWDKSQLDLDYVIKIGVDNVSYWMPVSYKDSRFLIEQVARKVYQELMVNVTLEVLHNDRVMTGGDVSLLGDAPAPSVLLSDYFTRDDVKEYAQSVMPAYVRGKDGGYDRFNYVVYPGEYKVLFNSGSENYYSEAISIKNSGLKRVFVH